MQDSAVEGGPSGTTGSRLGGAPYLAPDETWPDCCGCQAPLRFAMQLNYDASVGPESGLLQFFYCADEACTESAGKLVRLVHPPVGAALDANGGLAISGWDITPAPTEPAQAAILDIVEAAERDWATGGAGTLPLAGDPQSELRLLMSVTTPPPSVAVDWN